MMLAWSAQAVREAESTLMAGLPEGELMARAAAGLVEIATARLAEGNGRAVVALVGPGNNGADALYAVAGLAELGLNAAAVHMGTVHPGALEAADGAGVVVVQGDSPEALAVVREADLVLDGILGIGGRVGLPTWAAPWLEAVSDTAYVLSVDLPSGQDPAGETLDPDGVFADETVTFSVAKPVHLLPPTEQAVGMLTVVDIGLELDTPPAVRRLTHDDAAALWPVPGPADDKYSRGVLGVVAGGESYTGAPLLTCTAAVTAGVGMVRYVGTPTPEALVRAAVPEAVHGVGRVQAWVVGPGLDLASRARGAKAQHDAARAAYSSDLPVVVDAGGLDLVDGMRSAPTLLTPHAGECATLLSRLEGAVVTRADVESSPVRHARRLRELTGAAVLLKGSTTVVVAADPDAAVWSQADAPSWLATAGAGDVLAGICGALLAAGLAPDEAGALGALVHGLAGERANPGGPVRALDVAHAVGATVSALLRRAR